MHIITSCIHKGGTGKTTCAVHLVHFLASLGRNVLMIDCDTQRNATQVLLGDIDVDGAHTLFNDQILAATPINAGGGVWVIPADDKLADIDFFPISAALTFRQRVKDVAHFVDVDYVIIDTPPTLGMGMIAPLIASDAAFAPLKPDAFGFPGIRSLLQRIEQVRDQYNPDLRFLGVLINLWTRRNKEQNDVVEALKRDFPQFTIPHAIGDRAAIGRISFSREPVWAVRNGAARIATKEMKAAMQWIFNEMENPSS